MVNQISSIVKSPWTKGATLIPGVGTVIAFFAQRHLDPYYTAVCNATSSDKQIAAIQLKNQYKWLHLINGLAIIITLTTLLAIGAISQQHFKIISSVGVTIMGLGQLYNIYNIWRNQQLIAEWRGEKMLVGVGGTSGIISHVCF